MDTLALRILSSSSTSSKNLLATISKASEGQDCKKIIIKLF